MPKVGKKEFDYTLEGIVEAEAYSEATGLPMSNAQDRSVQTYIHGGRVNQPQGVTGQLGTPSISPVRELGQSPISPSLLGTRGYKKGGKVNKKKGYKK